MNRTRVVRIVAAVAAFLVVMLGVPQLANAGQLFFASGLTVAIIFATSTNLLFGQAGIPSFGQAGFFGAGAYATALASLQGLPVLLSLFVGVIAAALVGAVAGLIAYRSSGLAFSMLTLAFSQSLYTLAIRTQSLGGYNGLAGFRFSSVLGIPMSDPGFIWYFAVVVALVVLAVFWVISRSPFGLALRAIKDDPVRALFLGINVRGYRTLAFVLAAAGAGVAGGLSAYLNQVVTPDSLYWTSSAIPVMMLVLGGMGAFLGPALGAVVFTGLEYYLSDLTQAYILYMGALLLGALMVLPKGLVSLPALIRRGRRRAATGGQQ